MADEISTQDYAVAHEALSLLGTKLPPARESTAAALEEAAGQRLELSYAAQVSVARFTYACLDKMSVFATGLSSDSQASDQPDVAERDVI